MTTSRAEVMKIVQDTGVVAVIRLSDPGGLRGVVDALIEGGVKALEVTMTVPRAAGLIEDLASTLPPGFALGAGTVLDAETARQVILAGAQFIVSPTLRPAVIEMCHRYDVASMPGCLSPTEILTAWEAGADVVKVFPATALGPGYIRDIHGPLPQVRLMPTGGVSRENAAEWIKAGALALGVGSSLVDRGAVAAGRFETITANARHFIQAVQQARGGQAKGGA